MPLDQARVQPWVALDGGMGQPLQTGGGLGARVAAADHHELQPRGPLGRILARVGEIELGDDVVADVGGLGQCLHAERVLREPGDVEGTGDAAGGQHDVVVRLVDDPAGDAADDADLGLRIHADGTARDDPGAVLRAAAQRHGDRLRGQHTGGDLGEERQIELVGDRRHQGDPGIVGGELPLQSANALHSGESCAHHQDPGSCHGVHPFLRLHTVCLERRRPFACPWTAAPHLLDRNASRSRQRSGAGPDADPARAHVQHHDARTGAGTHRENRGAGGAAGSRAPYGGCPATGRAHPDAAGDLTEETGER
ncbi:hypothetical protein SHIRM173S_11918 [Streptomyces hirsutus]